MGNKLAGDWVPGREFPHLQRTGSLRREFKDHAIAGGAAEDCAAVEVALVVEGEVACRHRSVDVVEAVQDGVGPLSFRPGRQFVNYAAVARPSSVAGRAVEIASRVHDQAAGERSPRAGSEVMDYGFLPVSVGAWRQLKHRAVAERAPDLGRAVEAA